MNKKNSMGEPGTLYNYPDVKVEKPCKECVLVVISKILSPLPTTLTIPDAGLEYPDGRDANTAEGLWLHHMVLLDVGAGRRDRRASAKLPYHTWSLVLTPRTPSAFFQVGTSAPASSSHRPSPMRRWGIT